MRRSVILVGGGRVGRHTAMALSAQRYRVTIVEKDATKCANLTDHDVTEVVEGDGTEDAILEEAGIEDADVVAGLTNDTPTNRTVAEKAADRSPDAKTIVRISQDGEEELSHLGHIDNVVYPAAAGAELAAEFISGG